MTALSGQFMTQAFTTVTSVFCLPDIDLFASRLNKNVALWECDPNALSVDAFSIDLCYAFPPFNMIGKIVKKLLWYKAEVGLGDATLVQPLFIANECVVDAIFNDEHGKLVVHT